MLASSGRDELDDLVRRECGTLNALFEVRPSVGFYDDAGAANAFAMPEVYDSANPDGTVLIGIELARSIGTSAKSLVPLIGVMAHEWGHLFQFKSGYAEEWGVRVELTADYMAGWYLYQTRSSDSELKTTVSGIFSDIGDTDFADPDHHGSPKQRSRILLSGAGAIWVEGAGGYSIPPSKAADAFKAAESMLLR